MFEISLLSMRSILISSFVLAAILCVGQDTYTIPVSAAKYFDSKVSYDVVEDQEHNYWVGCNTGLYRFDGGNSINVRDLVDDADFIDESVVYDIRIDDNNQLWVSTQTKGIAVIDLQTYALTRIPIHTENDTIYNYTTSDMDIDNRTTWASIFKSSDIEGGILEINQSTFATELTQLDNIIVPGNLLANSKEDSILWVAGEALTRFNKDSKTYTYIEYDSTVNADHLIYLTQSKNGDLYILYRNHRSGVTYRDKSIVTYDVSEKQFTIKKNLDDLESNIYHLNMIADSTLMITCDKEPHYRSYNIYTETFDASDKYDDLIKSYGKVSILENNDIAIGGYNVNLIKRAQQSFESIPISIDHKVKSLYPAPGFWHEGAYMFPKLSTSAYQYSLDTVALAVSAKPLSGEHNHRAFYAKDDLHYYIVARDAVLRVNHDNGQIKSLLDVPTYFQNEDLSNMFYNSCRDEIDNIWISTSANTVLQLSTKEEEITEYKMPSYDADNPSFIFDICADSSNTVYAAGRFEVFTKPIDSDTFISLADKYPELPLDKNWIPYSIASIDTDEILLGTWNHGIFRIDLDLQTVQEVHPTNNNKEIKSIRRVDEDHFFIIGSGFASLYNIQTNAFVKMDFRNGLSNPPLRNPLVLSYKDKALIGSNMEFALFDVDSLLNASNQKIVISRIAVNGKPLQYDRLQNNLNLKHDQNTIQVQFALTELDVNNSVKYHYKLTPGNSEWQDIGTQKSLFFSNLPPDTYKLVIKSTNTDGLLLDNEMQLKIKIAPPWYKTWWFRVLLTLAILTILSSILKFYIDYQRRNLENERRFAQLETMILKSQMNPHFIFNSLNSIRYLFMKDQKDKGLRYITKFAKLLRSTLHHGEHALVPLAEELELTELYIDLEQLRFNDQFSLVKDYEGEEWKHVPIPPFILQPIVENAFWHGLCRTDDPSKRLHIMITKRNHEVSITIEDNGVGLEAPSTNLAEDLGKSKSFGLNLIKERFDLMNKTQSQQYILMMEESTIYSTGAKVVIKIKNTDKIHA